MFKMLFAARPNSIGNRIWTTLVCVEVYGSTPTEPKINKQLQILFSVSFLYDKTNEPSPSGNPCAEPKSPQRKSTKIKA